MIIYLSHFISYVRCFNVQEFSDNNSEELCTSKATEQTLCEMEDTDLDKHHRNTTSSSTRKSTLWLVALGCYRYRVLPKEALFFWFVWSYETHVTHNNFSGNSNWEPLSWQRPIRGTQVSERIEKEKQKHLLTIQPLGRQHYLNSLSNEDWKQWDNSL